MVTVRENNDFVVVVGWILIKSPRARSSEVDLYIVSSCWELEKPAKAANDIGRRERRDF
jgi:hypothetical protein